jgi:hypothetical protein
MFTLGMEVSSKAPFLMRKVEEGLYNGLPNDL